MANLTQQNQDLQKHLASVTAQLASMQSALQCLTATGDSPKIKKTKAYKKAAACCWTHGGTFNVAHTNQT